MIIHVARHGETVDNAEGRYSGSADAMLNETGIRQAQELAVKLGGNTYDTVISSPLVRARRTAELAIGDRPLPIIVMPQFAERQLGVYEGLSKDEINARYPEMWARNCTRGVDDAPDGGETLRQFCERVEAGLVEMISKYIQSKRVLLVCHAGTAKAINRYFLGLSYEAMHDFTINNCEYAEYTVRR